MSVIHAEAVRAKTRPPARCDAVVKRRSGSSVGALHVHALAIAQAAIAGYREFAAHVADHGDDDLADLFIRLAELEAEHAFHLAEAGAAMVSPKFEPDEYAWLHGDPQFREARDFIFRVLTPRQALEIAVRAEQRAKALFEQALAASNDPRDRELAIAFGRDEDSHIAWLQDALARMPEPFRPSEEFPGDPTTPQEL